MYGGTEMSISVAVSSVCVLSQETFVYSAGWVGCLTAAEQVLLAHSTGCACHVAMLLHHPEWQCQQKCTAGVLRNCLHPILLE